MQSRFTAYAGDCRVSGTLDAASAAAGDPLDARALEEDTPLALTDVVLERLDDGRRVTRNTIAVSPGDLFAVERSSPTLRGAPRRSRSRVHVQVGPYAIMGEVDERATAPRPARMLAVARATISWVRNGQIEMREVDGLLVNRAVVDWVVADGGGRDEGYPAVQPSALPG